MPKQSEVRVLVDPVVDGEDAAAAASQASDADSGQQMIDGQADSQAGFPSKSFLSAIEIWPERERTGKKPRRCHYEKKK